MTAIMEHFAEHRLCVDPHDLIDGIELQDHQRSRPFRVAIITVKHRDGDAYYISASGPLIAGPQGALATRDGYARSEWHSLDYVPEPIRLLIDAHDILRSATARQSGTGIGGTR